MNGASHIPRKEKPEMERLKEEQVLPELSSQMVTMLTTEHYNLQTGRSMTVADANGRCTLFIGAVSGALIAIAFTGQVSRMGTAFFVFSLVLLPSLLLMGLITFERVLQSAIEDLTYARGIMRIRHLYLSMLPNCDPTSSLQLMMRGDGQCSRWGSTPPGGRSFLRRRG